MHPPSAVNDLSPEVSPNEASPFSFPTSYGADLIVVQPRDPWWLHSYWELMPAALERGRARLGDEARDAHMVLRVYEEDTPRWFDVPLTHDARDWAIPVDPPDRAWTVEIGLKGPRGTFVALARSNTVRTPPDRPSDRIDETWGWLSSIPAGWPGVSSMVRPAP